MYRDRPRSVARRAGGRDLRRRRLCDRPDVRARARWVAVAGNRLGLPCRRRRERDDLVHAFRRDAGVRGESAGDARSGADDRLADGRDGRQLHRLRGRGVGQGRGFRRDRRSTVRRRDRRYALHGHDRVPGRRDRDLGRPVYRGSGDLRHGFRRRGADRVAHAPRGAIPRAARDFAHRAGDRVASFSRDDRDADHPDGARRDAAASGRVQRAGARDGARRRDGDRGGRLRRDARPPDAVGGAARDDAHGDERRADGPAQSRRLSRRIGAADRRGDGERRAGRALRDRSRPFQGNQRRPRPQGGRRGACADCAADARYAGA